MNARAGGVRSKIPTVMMAASIVIGVIAVIVIASMLYEMNRSQRYALVAVFPGNRIEISRWPTAAACEAAHQEEERQFLARGLVVRFKCEPAKF